MERDQTIDIAKGIGIVLVVWGHTACPIKSEIYLFHMPLFFILSGYLFNDKKSFKDTAKRKIKSLIIPYLFFFIFAELFFIILYSITGKYNQILLSTSILTRPYGVVGPLWFLLSLFETTLLYSLICKISINKTIRFLLSLILTVIGYIVSQKNIILPFFISTSFSMIIFFYVGSILKQQALINYRNKYLQLIFISIIFILYALGIYNKIELNSINNVIDKNFILYLLSSTSGALIIIFLSYIINYKSTYLKTIFSYLGKESLLIFALHKLSFSIVTFFLNISSLESGIYLEGLFLLVCGTMLPILIGIPIKKKFSYIFR